MRSLSCICLWLSLLFFATLSNAQNKKVAVAKKSPWITSVPFNTAATPPEGQSSSIYYLLIDEQENVATEERYFHYVYKILTTEGIQERSDISIDFDPSYHGLTIHEVRILRGDQSINQLSRDIRTVQREESMDRYLYDGTNTAIINLKDVRKGDIIEYSYTRKGYNPVHAGHFSRIMYFDYYSATEKGFQKIVLPKSQNFSLTFGHDEKVPFETSEKGNLITYSWSFDNIQPIEQENNTPSWYEPDRSVLITDFLSWKDVAGWATNLFAMSNEEKQKIKRDVLPAFKETDTDKFILEAIRFVQDEVRYLGFENGLNSHKPHSPVTTYEQRFGDCKDKSVLLVALLEARGITAFPMLVSTTLADKLAVRAPSSIHFNHCVVKIVQNNKNIFIDPTISNQGGTLDTYFFPDYKRGLVISPGTDDLEVLPAPLVSSTTEEQTFDVEKIGGAAVFTITTTYAGYDADSQRGEFARNDLESLQKSYLSYYANLYPDIKKVADLKFTDDRETNELIVEERYSIPSFWRPSTEEEVIYCEVSAQTLNNYFDVSKSNLQRKSPYRLSYPVNYYHNTHLNLPEEWNITPTEDFMETSSYLFDYEVTKVGKKISRYMHYKTKDDHIPVERMKKFVNDHDKMANVVSYQLTYDKRLAVNSDEKNYSGMLVTFIALGFGAWLMLWLYKHFNPVPHVHHSEGIPIGGWLFVVAFGLCIAPISLLVEVSKNAQYYFNGEWIGFLRTGQYALLVYSIISHVFNLIQVLFSVLIIVLFFERRSSFPLLMTIQLGASFLMIATHIIILQITNDPGLDYSNIYGAFITAAIWIPYLNMSSRVKETFVNQSEYGDPNRYRNI